MGETTMRLRSVTSRIINGEKSARSTVVVPFRVVLENTASSRARDHATLRWNEYLHSKGNRMKIKRIEHVGVVVRNVDASRKLWEECFGIPLGGVEQIPGRTNKLALYPVGESMVELLAGVTPDNKFSKMCDDGKAGIHHICFEVEDIDEALTELKSKGIPLLDQTPRIGHAGCRIAFLDPAGTEGCLIELAQLPAQDAA
jgi:methylmalonyl-CoA epimerase